MIKLLKDNVLVKLDEAETITAGGIIIPDPEKERTIYGELFAVGQDCTLKAGDRVLIHLYDGIEMELDGVKYIYIHEEDLIGKL
jgi:chaperonin GroES